jgi:hypothetical protein
MHKIHDSRFLEQLILNRAGKRFAKISSLTTGHLLRENEDKAAIEVQALVYD